ncbi:MAG: PA2169 family four-helix-bundle protein [Cyclobacteriaceae bacterium]
MNTDNNLNNNIKDVIERNIDACKGYEKAAEKVSNPQLSNAFREQAKQRKDFALSLEAQANVLGSEARERVENGTFEGNLHRTWMDVKTAFSSDKDEAVLEECIRGEKEALNEYNELLNESTLTGQSYDLINSQRQTVQSCVNELERMEELVD